MKKINIDDPRITKYALGEMLPEEAESFEKEIENNTDIAEEIKEIKAFSAILSDSLNEPALTLSEERKEKIADSAALIDNNTTSSGNVKRFPGLILKIAAAFIITAISIVFVLTNYRESLSPVKNKTQNSENLKVKTVFADESLNNKTGNLQVESENIETPDRDDIVIEPISASQPSQKNERSVSAIECQARCAKSQYEPVKKMRISKNQSRKKRLNAPLPLQNVMPKKDASTIADNKLVSRRVKECEKRKMVFEDFAECERKECFMPETPSVGNYNFNTESYSVINENKFMSVKERPLSTFSIDVDTASYSNVRRFLNNGVIPPPDAVRIEEMINYFSYEYPEPEDGKPFSVNFQLASCPWNQKHKLVKIGIKGREFLSENRPQSNLVFLLDVSGSMMNTNKLPLLKKAMKMLVENLNKNDKVAIVVYAGASGVVLPSTSADQKDKIFAALERLDAGGSTNGSAGIKLAYQIAAANFITNGVNRVILATDGDFNVGTTDQGSLEELISRSAKSGVFLTVLGFGMGNYKDSTLEMLADKGNGNYAYIDNEREAKKVFVNDLTSNLVTIAKDVKIQIEFNPFLLDNYRLIGYENRMLKKEDFNDDQKDAGEIGAGHTVTALYEIVPKGCAVSTPAVDPLKYSLNNTGKKNQQIHQQNEIAEELKNELMTVKIRYKKPEENQSKKLIFTLKDNNRKFESTGCDFKLATAVAEFGMILRNSRYKGELTIEDALKLARESVSKDPFGYRKELISIMEKFKRLLKMKK
jgi:Ca-activated chloride channel family protein